jgi:hypothetical protein
MRCGEVYQFKPAFPWHEYKTKGNQDMSKLNLSPFARYRLSVTSRVLAAVIGGYALTSALTVLLALISPIDPPKMAAQLVSFPLYLCLLLWIFHAKSVARTWGWLVLWTLVAVALCWWKLKGGAS